MAATLEPITRVEQFLNDIIEQGGGGGGGSGGASALIVHMDETNVLDKTWQEIHDAAPLVWYKREFEVNEVNYLTYCIIADCNYEPGYGYVSTFYDLLGKRSYDFLAETANAYPTKQD